MKFAFRSFYANPVINLAIEDYLFRLPKLSNSTVLFLYRNGPCVVLGRNQNPFTECNLRSQARDNIPLVRRQSGGGTVYHDLGNTNYSIMMPRGEFDMRRSAQLVCDALRRHLDIPASLTNRNDISVKERKVSGSAYRIIQHRAFHHGTMLIDCDLQRLHRYLYAPLANNNNNNNFLAKRRIESKGVASVRSEVANLRDYSLTITHSDFCNAVAKEFFDSAQPPKIIDLNGDLEMRDYVLKTAKEMMSWSNVYGMTPTFTLTAQTEFTRWGHISCQLTSRRGLMESISLDGDAILQDSVAASWFNRLIGAPFSSGSFEMENIGDNSLQHDLCEWLATIIQPTPLTEAPSNMQGLLDDVLKC